jgi:hypothetical protein
MMLIDKILNWFERKMTSRRLTLSASLEEKVGLAVFGTEFIVNEETYAVESIQDDPDGTRILFFRDGFALSVHESSAVFLKVTKRARGESWKPLPLERVS